MWRCKPASSELRNIFRSSALIFSTRTEVGALIPPIPRFCFTRRDRTDHGFLPVSLTSCRNGQELRLRRGLPSGVWLDGTTTPTCVSIFRRLPCPAPKVLPSAVAPSRLKRRGFCTLGFG